MLDSSLPPLITGNLSDAALKTWAHWPSKRPHGPHPHIVAAVDVIVRLNRAIQQQAGFQLQRSLVEHDTSTHGGSSQC